MRLRRAVTGYRAVREDALASPAPSRRVGRLLPGTRWRWISLISCDDAYSATPPAPLRRLDLPCPGDAPPAGRPPSSGAADASDIAASGSGCPCPCCRCGFLLQIWPRPQGCSSCPSGPLLRRPMSQNDFFGHEGGSTESALLITRLELACP